MRLLVARPEGQAETLCARLRDLGIEPVPVPAIEIVPPESSADLERAIARLPEYDWLVFTSRNAVAAVFDRLPLLGRGASLPRLLAIGPATAQALRDRGVRDVWMPSRALSEAIGEEMPIRAGERVLRLRAERASAEPTRLLRDRGAVVDEVVVYRTVEAPPASRSLLAAAVRDGLDGVIVTSASTVRGLVRLAQDVGCLETLRALPTVAIGPVTARALEEAGLRVDLVASTHTAEGIVAVLRERGIPHAGVAPA
ncbi:MAG: uroporphyrinogen-III synthase [Armatimonadota bacterium]|nr:uroporphyrinogen-III synthase [Armatimonadota bacterium]